MQVTTLKNPGQNVLAQTVRRNVAKIISDLEIADVTGTPEPLFAAFLQDAAIKTPGYVAPTLPATQVIVSNGGTINVENSAGNLDSPATATVAGGVLTGAKLAATKTIVTAADAITVRNSSGVKSVAATAAVAVGVVTNVNLTSVTDAIISSGGSAPVFNSAGTGVPGTHPITCAGGLLSSVALASTVGVVVNAVKQSGWTVTGTGTFFTPTVVNGVCTGGVLSAS